MGRDRLRRTRHPPSKGMQMTDQKVDEAKGRAKEAAGSLTDDKELKKEGKADKAASSMKKKVDNAVDAAKDKLSGDDKD